MNQNLDYGPEARRQKSFRVIGTIVAVIPLVWLLACSPGSGAGAKTEPAKGTGGTAMSLETVIVPVTNVTTTLIGFPHWTDPPWADGNFLTFRFRKARAFWRTEEWASWLVVNIHSENFAEIARRLRLNAVEVHVLHTRRFPVTIRSQSGVRRAFEDEGYALVTDSRIPREWLLSEPGENSGKRNQVDPETAVKLKTAFPTSFRAAK